MKKIMSVLMVLIILSGSTMSFAVPAFAVNVSDPDDVLRNFIPADAEITQEIIDEYGIVSTDEFGNEVITIPMGPATSGEYIEASDYNPDEDVEGYVHDGHTIPGYMLDNFTPGLYHFCLTPHTHEVINLRSSSGKWLRPVTSYADEGFTVTKAYDKSIEVNASLDLKGGISKKIAEGSIGVSIGGSYTRGSSEEYTKTIPDGYKGRIVYYFDCTTYNFTNKTTYIWPNTIPLLMTYEYDACSAQGAPRNGYFGLQLVRR